jgi:hypothetical protein
LLTDPGILGGRYGAALSLPMILHARGWGLFQTEPGEARRRSERSGIGDLNIEPLQLTGAGITIT